MIDKPEPPPIRLVQKGAGGNLEAPMPPAKVIPFGGITKMDLPSERLLQKAIEADLEGVVILGFTKDGDEYMASSYADGATVVWLAERLKHRLITSDGVP